MEKEETIKRLNKFHPERHKCIMCGEDIIYDNTSVGEKGKVYGKSYQTIKNVNKIDYKLQVCQHCLLKKYPNIKNLSRTFNIMSEMTKFAFQIPDNVFEDSRAKYAMTEKHMIEKYGEEVGQKKWDEYCKKQAETNTFEYKQKTYGWTKEQFDEYNKNRTCTLENFINRWGKEDGQKRWNNYVDRQIITKSKDWYVKEHGEEAWKEMNAKKCLTLENFIRKYGKEQGAIKYEIYLSHCNNGYSQVSQKFFTELDKYLGKKYNTKYALKNYEKVFQCGTHHYSIDYYIPELNLAVEFNGDAWHGNPNIYKAEDCCHPYDKTITAKFLWHKDKLRYNQLKKYHNIDTVVVWEYDYNHNFDFKKFIKEKLNIDLCNSKL